MKLVLAILGCFSALAVESELTIESFVESHKSQKVFVSKILKSSNFRSHLFVIFLR
jgi:hypothetical protein